MSEAREREIEAIGIQWMRRALAAEERVAMLESGMRDHKTYADGWADGEQFVLDNWRDYALRRHPLGRLWIRVRRAVQRRFGWGMYAHPIFDLDREADDE